MSSNEGDKAIFKDRISELQKYNEEQRHLFLDFNKKLSNSKSNDSDPNELSTSILINSSTLPIRPNGQAVPSELPVQSKEEVPLEQRTVQKTVDKKVYQFDTENHLMDGDGNYILTEQGQPIKLSEEQIQALIESNAIEVVD